MKLKFFCLLTVLAVLMGLSGCGSRNDPPEDEYMYDLVITEDESASTTPKTEAAVQTTAETTSQAETSAETTPSSVTSAAVESSENAEYVEYWFRTRKLPTITARQLPMWSTTPTPSTRSKRRTAMTFITSRKPTSSSLFQRTVFFAPTLSPTGARLILISNRMLKICKNHSTALDIGALAAYNLNIGRDGAQFYERMPV